MKVFLTACLLYSICSSCVCYLSFAGLRTPILRCKHISESQFDIIVHENVREFPEELMVTNLRHFA